MPEIFRDARLKIERAKKHVSDLNSEIERFWKSKPYRIVVEKDSQTSRKSLIIRVCRKPPDFGCIIGDAIHNLRCALDHLACELVRLNGASDADVYFPFSYKGGKSLEEAIKKRKISRAAPDVVQVVRRLKPYHRGNPKLRALHDLDIIDKHKMLIVYSHNSELANLIERGRVVVWFQNLSTRAEDGAFIMELPPERNIKVSKNPRPSLDIHLGDGFFKGQPVLPTLYQLVQLIEGIVRTFEKVPSVVRASSAP